MGPLPVVQKIHDCNITEPMEIYKKQYMIWGFILKELWNHNRKIFLCSPQKSAEAQPTFWTAFFQNKFKLWHIRLYIQIWKTKFTSYKQYFSGLIFLRNAKKTDTDQNILQAFLFCLKRSFLQTFNSSSCKKAFPKCVYHWYNLLWWMFFILCDNWEEHFFTQSYRYQEAWCNRHVSAFFETNVLKEVHVLCPLFPQ